MASSLPPLQRATWFKFDSGDSSWLHLAPQLSRVFWTANFIWRRRQLYQQQAKQYHWWNALWSVFPSMVPPYYQVHGGGVGKFPLRSIKHYAKRANCSFAITVRTVSLRSRNQLQANGLTIVISPVCLITRRRTRGVGICRSKTAPWLVTRRYIKRLIEPHWTASEM